MAMNPRITVVEDEEALSVLLRYNLEAEGYEVDTVLRGDEAEIRLQERVPDLLILDWMLPGISGIELCRRLRARAETERLPIIMLIAVEYNAGVRPVIITERFWLERYEITDFH